MGYRNTSREKSRRRERHRMRGGERFRPPSWFKDGVRPIGLIGHQTYELCVRYLVDRFAQPDVTHAKVGELVVL